VCLHCQYFVIPPVYKMQCSVKVVVLKCAARCFEIQRGILTLAYINNVMAFMEAEERNKEPTIHSDREHTVANSRSKGKYLTLQCRPAG
jgi:hypothetical protein